MLPLIPAPYTFVEFYNLYKHVQSQEAIDSTFIFGKNKAEWIKFLLKEIPKDQLTKPYGGTKEFGFNKEDIEEMGGFPC